jgi:hypothetical protein
VTDLKITPDSPMCTYSGNISITGKASPGDIVTIVTTYVKEVNVTDGKYEYDAGLVPIPAHTTLCTVTAENVKDMTISTNVWGIIPISKTQDACNGKASLSAPYIPKGNYSLVIDGNAISTNAIANCNDGTDTQKTVKLTFVAKVEVKADCNGYFKQVCCTKRPAGEYTLKVGDKTTTVTLIDCDDTDKDTCNGVSTNDESSASVTANKLVSSSGGTGNATVAVMNSASELEAPVEEVGGSEDVNSMPDQTVESEPSNASPQTNSIWGYIEALIEWLS